MSKFVPRSLLLLLVFLWAGIAAAENFDSEVASIILLQIKAVQKELGVTELQRAAMNKFADAHRARLGDYYKKVEKAGGTPDEQKLLVMFREMKKGVLSQMSPAQIKRLREISLQTLDFVALSDKTVGAKVGLSPSQLAQIGDIVKLAEERADGIRDDAVKKATDGQHHSSPKSKQEYDSMIKDRSQRVNAAIKSILPQVESIRAESKKQVMDILTPDQKAKWQALLGSPFRGLNGSLGSR